MASSAWLGDIRVICCDRRKIIVQNVFNFPGNWLQWIVLELSSIPTNMIRKFLEHIFRKGEVIWALVWLGNTYIFPFSVRVKNNVTPSAQYFWQWCSSILGNYHWQVLANNKSQPSFPNTKFDIESIRTGEEKARFISIKISSNFVAV